MTKKELENLRILRKEKKQLEKERLLNERKEIKQLKTKAKVEKINSKVLKSLKVKIVKVPKVYVKKELCKKIIGNFNDKGSGVYILKAIDKDIFYVGSSVHMLTRIKEHVSQLSKNTHHCSYLQNFTNKYGIDAIYLYSQIPCREEDLALTEQYYIDLYLKESKIFNSVTLIQRTTTEQQNIYMEKKLKSFELKTQKYTYEQVLLIKALSYFGCTYRKEIANITNTTTDVVSRLKNKESWQFISEEEIINYIENNKEQMIAYKLQCEDSYKKFYKEVGERSKIYYQNLSEEDKLKFTEKLRGTPSVQNWGEYLFESGKYKYEDYYTAKYLLQQDFRKYTLIRDYTGYTITFIRTVERKSFDWIDQKGYLKYVENNKEYLDSILSKITNYVFPKRIFKMKPKVPKNYTYEELRSTLQYTWLEKNNISYEIMNSIGLRKPRRQQIRSTKAYQYIKENNLKLNSDDSREMQIKVGMV